MRRSPKSSATAAALVLCALSSLACHPNVRTGSQIAADDVGLRRTQVELGRGLRDVRVEEALLDSATAPLRGQVTLSYRGQGARRVYGAFQWKDEAGINLGGRVEVMKQLRRGEPVTFTGHAPSPEAFSYVFDAYRK